MTTRDAESQSLKRGNRRLQESEGLDGDGLIRVLVERLSGKLSIPKGATHAETQQRIGASKYVLRCLRAAVGMDDCVGLLNNQTYLDG